MFVLPQKSKRDALILVPVSVSVLGFMWVFDSILLGASRDLVQRYLPLYFAAWLSAWLIGSAFLGLSFVSRKLNHFARCLMIIALFWPIHGIAIAVAEEWTISYREATWTQHSDMGYTYMYGEMSGSGYARGLARWERNVCGQTLFGLVAGVVWLPTLLLSCYTWRRILGDSPDPEKHERTIEAAPNPRSRQIPTRQSAASLLLSRQNPGTPFRRPIRGRQSKPPSERK